LGSRLVEEYNEVNVCDDAYTEEIDIKIGCLDDDANILHYRDKIKGVEVYIAYSFKEKEYMVFFRKIDERFVQHETEFTAKTWVILKQHIQSELRNAGFSRFIGIVAKKRAIETIKEKRKKNITIICI
jgi:hypothetical protein